MAAPFFVAPRMAHLSRDTGTDGRGIWDAGQAPVRMGSGHRGTEYGIGKGENAMRQGQWGQWDRRAVRWGIMGVVLLCVLAASGAGAMGIHAAMRDRCHAFGAPIACHGPRDRPRVALSFDDGPSRAGLDAVLPVLAREHVSATFFLIGETARERPDQVRRIAAAGHEIGNHSYRHGRMTGLFADAYAREIRDTDAAFRAAGVPVTRWFRPPHGLKFLGLAHAVEETGKEMVLWDVEEPSGKGLSPHAYAERIVAGARPGSILLLHVLVSTRETERAALPLVIAGLKRRGFEIVTVGELLDGRG